MNCCLGVDSAGPISCCILDTSMLFTSVVSVCIEPDLQRRSIFMDVKSQEISSEEQLSKCQKNKGLYLDVQQDPVTLLTTRTCRKGTQPQVFPGHESSSHILAYCYPLCEDSNRHIPVFDVCCPAPGIDCLCLCLLFVSGFLVLWESQISSVEPARNQHFRGHLYRLPAINIKTSHNTKLSFINLRVHDVSTYKNLLPFSWPTYRTKAPHISTGF